MRLPSIKTLNTVFSDPKAARKIFEMTREQLLTTDAGKARDKECSNPPKTYDIRLHVLNSLESGFNGAESMASVDGEYAEYLNTGDTYTPTVIYWRGAYRVQAVGDFVEVMQRQGVRFL